MNRRGFLQTVAGTTFAFHVVPRHVLGRGFTPPSEKLNIAGIGIGGQGGGVIRDMATENIVALCDVDSNKAAGTFKAFPKAEQFRDYRVLLDKRKDIDAVMIATPDHMHAPITIAALRAGKHVYVEKPMAHSIEEARVMTARRPRDGPGDADGEQRPRGRRAAADARMARRPVRSGRCARSIAGPIGRASGGSRTTTGPAETPPVPASLDWDLWIGAAPMRPYSKLYHPARLAGMVRLRHRGAGRHGHPQHGPGVLCPRPRHADGRRGQDERAEAGIVPALDRAAVRVRRQGRSAGGDAHLVRRREDAAEAARPPGRDVARRQRHLLRRRQGDDRLRRLVGAADPLPGEPPQGIPDTRQRRSPARSGTARSGSRRARITSRRTPRRALPIRAPSPRRSWWETWPCASRSGSNGTRPT